ncbi:MOSC domain-containing protein [Evansella clarkii]|uniref:MOSC domain-containing protein n=1 Tax=Evansella clarkii TaxID=79879 RepID=UPI000996D82C|nr:MOSC domain-containing protein [Evansella clarkii]
MKRLKANIISVNVGKPQTLSRGEKSVTSALEKTPAEGTIFLSRLNLAGDGQADLTNHGGEDKAVCVYAYDHYPFWEEELGQSLPLGAFGENLTVKGLVEEAVHIGDVFQWGEAQVQVSQPRVPCYKVGMRFGVKELPKLIAETGYTGFYMRVLKEGYVSADNPLQFVKRYSEISIAYVNHIYYEDRHNEEALKEISSIPELAAKWRESIQKQLA